MKFLPVNLLHKLNKQQTRFTKHIDVLREVHAILEQDSKIEKRIDKTLKNNKTSIANAFKFELLETHRIYHIEAIKQICIEYRLRFLESQFFKPEFPRKAIEEIKALEKTHETALEGFKIMAPAKLLKLKNADDPVLFVRIGNGYYYLIHKWGNDMNAFRKLKMLPFKTLETLLIFALAISFSLTLLIPHGGTGFNSSTFWILFLFMFKSVVGVIIFYGIAKGKNVSSAIWNSKYYNG